MTDNTGNPRGRRGSLFTTAAQEDLSVTIAREDFEASQECLDLLKVYEWIAKRESHSWTTHLNLREKLGSGGQGIVFLTERRGADGFTDA